MFHLRERWFKYLNWLFRRLLLFIPLSFIARQIQFRFVNIVSHFLASKFFRPFLKKKKLNKYRPKMFLKQRTFNKRGNKSCILFWKYSNILRWTAMWASDCRSQLLNQYSLLFIVICVCSLFFIYSIFFVGVFYVIYFDNSNIVYCIYKGWLAIAKLKPLSLFISLF